jgi:8-hydroxy-5-deazaflavin:NADPH oxidoreductase
VSLPIHIGVIGGTGQEGRGVALRLARAGASVIIGSRSIERGRQTIDRLREAAGELPLIAGDNGAVVDECDVIFLAVPFAHAAGVVEAYAQRFRRESLLIDVTVPVTFASRAPRLTEVPEGSATEHIRRRLPERVQLAAALKTVPARLLGGDQSLDCDDFICGDSAEARSRASEVLQLFPGLRLIDVGPLETARTIERMTVLAIAINERYQVHDARFRVVGL